MWRLILVSLTDRPAATSVGQEINIDMMQPNKNKQLYDVTQQKPTVT